MVLATIPTGGVYSRKQLLAKILECPPGNWSRRREQFVGMPGAILPEVWETYSLDGKPIFEMHHHGTAQFPKLDITWLA